MKFRKQRTYQAYADIYDNFKGDRSSTIYLLADLIEKYRPRSRTLLDLACGTGSIAQGLASAFDVLGVDNSTQMLKIAKQKLPGMQFVLGEMDSFTLRSHFDVVYCLHNSVNHLTTFQQWQKMFHTVANHLVTGGLFIFDINPIDKMDRMAKQGPSAYQVGADYVITQVFKDEGAELYTWDMKIMLKEGSKYIVKHEPVRISTHSDHKITEALRAEFTLLERFKPSSPSTLDDLDRVYYVCAKRALQR